jgi:hypothetical protein
METLDAQVGITLTRLAHRQALTSRRLARVALGAPVAQARTIPQDDRVRSAEPWVARDRHGMVHVLVTGTEARLTCE